MRHLTAFSFVRSISAGRTLALRLLRAQHWHTGNINTGLHLNHMDCAFSYIPRWGVSVAAALLMLTCICQAQVTVIIHRPHPTQMHVEMLWNIDLINPGALRMVKLQGRATETRTGRWIASGVSASFELPSGFTSINAADLSPIDYDADPEYDDIVTRTGRVPSGEYTICVFVLDAVTDEILGEDCIEEHVVLNVLPPQLIYPRDNSTITEALPVFTWAPASPVMTEVDISYALRVVEVIGRQSPFDALESNPPWFEEEELPITVAHYPLSAEPLEPETRYAWQVIAFAEDPRGGQIELARSEMWVFTLDAESGLTDFETPSGENPPTKTVLASGALDETPVDYGTFEEPPRLLPVFERSQRNADELAAEQAALRVAEDLQTVETCGNLRAEFRRTNQGDSVVYSLVLINNYKGTADAFSPRSFQMMAARDSVLSIAGATPKGWKRASTSGPESRTTWTRNSGTMPSGETVLGSVRFSSLGSSAVTVRYQWMNAAQTVICSDSTTLSQSQFYYQLSSQQSEDFLEIPQSPLNVQYQHDYAPVLPVTASILDIQTQTTISSANQNQPTISHVNGLNRITVPLNDYELVAGRHYVLVISDYKGNHLFNFKIINSREN